MIKIFWFQFTNTKLNKVREGVKSFGTLISFVFETFAGQLKSLYECARVEAGMKRRSNLMALPVKRRILLKLKVNVVNLDVVKNIRPF